MSQTIKNKPDALPRRPQFSSGPCAKRPGWSLDALKDGAVGRSHRSEVGQSKLGELIERSKDILGIPQDYVLGIVPASDTGAFEMAMWSMLGQRPIDVLVWESFSNGWAQDITKHLGIEDTRVLKADYGHLPDLNAVRTDADTVFVYNGTTSGVRLPNGDWIDDKRDGLTLCDATSAVFAMPMPWQKLDVITWSWQKVLGGEAAHGMLALSPKAVERLQTYTPPWPLPKIFRMTKNGALNAGIFKGSTINTPSMLAVEDCLDALKWAESLGGLEALIQRSQQNLACIAEWEQGNPRLRFLAEQPEFRSSTSICLRYTLPALEGKTDAECKAFGKEVAQRLTQEGAGFDLNAYRDAPAGIRIWGGATVETADIAALLPWIDWAIDTTAQTL